MVNSEAFVKNTIKTENQMPKDALQIPEALNSF